MNTLFQVWAPNASSVSLIAFMDEKEFTYPMKREKDGYFKVTLSDLSPTVDYYYCLNNDKRRPDPRSKWQPHGVHGPSRLLNTQSFTWNDQNWKGIPLSDYIIYEMHIAAFTQEGTFDSAIEKLPYLKDLGITAIEMMPMIAFPGERNWGYDGTYLFAPHQAYGGPFGLQRLIDACHKEGLSVILDLVYNHLGPEGNYLSEFGPYFSHHYQTQWGQAVNFDGAYSDHVRRFVIDNALFWVTEYHVDAIRLDAIQTIYDFGAKHILEQLQTELQEKAKHNGRYAYLTAESDLNDVRVINSGEKGGYGLNAQWHDDFHHSLNSALTNNHKSYFADFGQMHHLAKAIEEGFVYDGVYSEFRKKTHGSSTKNIPGGQLIVCIQNHDQIGNAAQGKRLNHVLGKEKMKLAAVILLTAPFIPLLFMGQEWSASTPFAFFTSFEDVTVATNVTNGRVKEHAFTNDHTHLDPQNPNCLTDSKLKWSERNEPEHAEMLHFYQKMLQWRKKFPSLSNCRKDLTKTVFSDENQWFIILRKDPSGQEALILANFAPYPQTIPYSFPQGDWSLLLDSSGQLSNEQNLFLHPFSAKIFIK